MKTAGVVPYSPAVFTKTLARHCETGVGLIMKKFLALTSLAAMLAFAPSPSAVAATTADAVLGTYGNIAHAGYEDSLITAKALKKAISALIATPSKATLAAAKAAWVKARVPYQQTEAYRFGNAIVDEWEGRVNAWPLDEGLIDYVAKSYGKKSDENPLYVINVISNPKLKIGGKAVDASKINAALLHKLHEAGEVEANVATGYHAIEFLLWGQDLNGTSKGAGKRPYTDFDTKNCTNGNCDRRGAYLVAATDLMISDLQEMVANWMPGGKARVALKKQGITAIVTGMGSLSYGELAGERMKLGLMLHDPEEEHDCFSDNTHNSHYYDAKGVQNVYLGRYVRINGKVVKGPSLSDMVKEKAPKVDKAMRAGLDSTMMSMGALKKRAETKESYDQMIGENNTAGNKVVQSAIDALVKQTKSIEKVVATLKIKTIKFEGSDSLDAPEKVGK